MSKINTSDEKERKERNSETRSTLSFRADREYYISSLNDSNKASQTLCTKLIKSLITLSSLSPKQGP